MGPCSNCGSMKRLWSMTLSAQTKVQASLERKWETIKRYWNRPATAVMVVFTVASSLTGLWFAGALGVAIGLVFGVAGTLVGLRSLTIVKTITIDRS